MADFDVQFLHLRGQLCLPFGSITVPIRHLASIMAFSNQRARAFGYSIVPRLRPSKNVLNSSVNSPFSAVQYLAIILDRAHRRMIALRLRLSEESRYSPSCISTHAA